MIDESTYRTLDAIASRLFKAGVFPRTVQNADVAFAVILAGHELGFAPMAAVRGITLVNGKVSLGADATVAACTRHRDVCGYFSCVESTDERAEYVTHRVGAPSPVTLSYTIAQAKRAGLTSNATWRTHTEAMLRARCAAALARSVYPDLVAGVYDPDEAAEIRGDHATATDVRPTAEVKPEPLALPRDNGPSPSQAAAALTAPDPVDHYDLAAKLIDGASTLPELAAAWGVVTRDHIPHLGPNERAAIVAAKDARKAALATVTPPSDDPPPDGPTKPRRGPRKAPQGEGAADSPAASQGATTAAQGGESAIDRSGARASNGASLESRAERRAYLMTLTYAPAVRTSAQRRGDLPGYIEDCAARLCAIDPALSMGEALAYLTAPAATQRRAA